jgi:hypothetical protein
MQVQGALPGDYKSRLCITSKGGYFVLGGIMKAKTPCENDLNPLSV